MLILSHTTPFKHTHLIRTKNPCRTSRLLMVCSVGRFACSCTKLVRFFSCLLSDIRYSNISSFPLSSVSCRLALHYKSTYSLSKRFYPGNKELITTVNATRALIPKPTNSTITTTVFRRLMENNASMGNNPHSLLCSPSLRTRIALPLSYELLREKSHAMNHDLTESEKRKALDIQHALKKNKKQPLVKPNKDPEIKKKLSLQKKEAYITKTRKTISDLNKELTELLENPDAIKTEEWNAYFKQLIDFLEARDLKVFPLSEEEHSIVNKLMPYYAKSFSNRSEFAEDLPGLLVKKETLFDRSTKKPLEICYTLDDYEYQIQFYKDSIELLQNSPQNSWELFKNMDIISYDQDGHLKLTTEAYRVIATHSVELGIKETGYKLSEKDISESFKNKTYKVYDRVNPSSEEERKILHAVSSHKIIAIPFSINGENREAACIVFTSKNSKDTKELFVQQFDSEGNINKKQNMYVVIPFIMLDKEQKRDVQKNAEEYLQIVDENGVSLYDKIYDIVRQIPVGKVATYGQVAELANLAGKARLVGYALYRVDIQSSDIPWHRVINAQMFTAPTIHICVHGYIHNFLW